MSWLWNISGGVSTVLQLLVVYYLLRGAYRKYPLLLLYSCVLLAATILEWVVFFQEGGAASVVTRAYQRLYWLNEAILRGLLFLLVITLTDRAIKDSPKRFATMRILWGGVALVVVASWAAWQGPFLSGRSWNIVARNLSFCAALLNLALWAALVRQRTKDIQLLLLSAGLGVEVTGQAIAYSIREFTQNVFSVQFPNILGVATHLLCLFVWLMALRSPSPARSESRADF